MNKIIVFGLGAIGSNIIAGLAEEMPEAEYYRIDADYIEKHELPLLPWSDQMYFSWRKVKAVFDCHGMTLVKIEDIIIK